MLPDRLTTGAGQDTGISISSDGTKLAFGMVSARKQLWALPFDAAAGVVRGPGEPWPWVLKSPSIRLSDVNGRTLVYRTMRGGRAEIRERSLEDGREQVLLAGMTTSPPHLSRDGSQLAYARANADGKALTKGLHIHALDRRR